MSLDEKVKAFLEFLRIAAWPALIAWLVWYFRDEVKRVITRITKLGLTGAEFAPPAEQVPTPPPKAFPQQHHQRNRRREALLLHHRN
jgi:hypothetical protein